MVTLKPVNVNGIRGKSLREGLPCPEGSGLSRLYINNGTLSSLDNFVAGDTILQHKQRPTFGFHHIFFNNNKQTSVQVPNTTTSYGKP